MKLIIAFIAAAILLAGCQTTRDPNVIPEVVTRHIATAGEWRKISLPPPQYTNMRFKSGDGYYLNYRPVRQIDGVTILYWDNEFIASMGYGHMAYRGDKVLIRAQSIRGQYQETTNEISSFRRLPADMPETEIDDVSASDLSFEFRANSTSNTNLNRNFAQRAVGAVSHDVVVNGETYRLPAFRVAYESKYDYHAVVTKGEFIYVPVLGVRMEGKWRREGLGLDGPGRTSDYSFEVNDQVLERIKASSRRAGA